MVNFTDYSHQLKNFLCIGSLSLLIGSASIGSAETKSPTNVIIIYTDDLGYGDLACYGAENYQTPELDRMAQEGMRFTDFSTSSSICTPSRAGLLTGRYAKRWGHDDKVYFPNSKGGMPPSEITIAELVKKAGYQTALIGKWHLGHQPQYLPTEQGFDYYYGIPYSNDMWHAPETPLAKNVTFNNGLTREDYLTPKKGIRKYQNKVPLMLNTEVIEWPADQTQLTRLYTKKTQEFIATNKDRPFFIYLAHAMPHIPLFASEKFKGKTKRGIFGDVIEELDWSVGEILKILREQGLAENTLVIFTSDNGPWLTKKEAAGTAGPLRDGKSGPFEGGCRVPCIAWQPKTVPAGVTCNVQTSTLDMLPTIAALAGVNIPQDRKIDGIDIRSVLAGSFENPPKREYFLYRGYKSIRMGDWKYLEHKKHKHLFNLSEDVGEKKNLIEKHPQKAEGMKKKLTEVLAEME